MYSALHKPCMPDMKEGQMNFLYVILLLFVNYIKFPPTTFSDLTKTAKQNSSLIISAVLRLFLFEKMKLFFMFITILKYKGKNLMPA